MKLSTTIEKILKDSADQSVTVGDLMDLTKGQGFGIAAGFLTLPMLIPWPVPVAGFSTLMGAGIAILGIQLALGYPQPVLPRRVARFSLSPQMSQRLLKYLSRVLHPLERLAKPRLTQVSRHRSLRRITGLCMSWNAVLLGLPLPIPLTNLIPAYTILFMVIGLLELDGLLILIGHAMTIVTTLFFVSISGAILDLIRSLLGA